MLKHAKENANKTRIVNVVDEDVMKEVQHKKSFKGLFDEEEYDEEPHHEHEHHF